MTRRPFALLLLLEPLACLPAETRARPGSLTVRVVAADGSAASAVRTSSDGWGLQLEQAYLGLGRVELEGDTCEAYGEAGYSRLFDLMRTEPQKVSLSYGLGACKLAFTVSGPRWDTLLGEGVTPVLAEQFRQPAADDDDGTGNAVSIYLAGNARRDDSTVHFAWPLRVRLTYGGCQLLDSSGTPTHLSLVGEQSQRLDLAVDAFALFRSVPGSSELGFDDIAATDQDTDGDITVDELSQAVELGSRLEQLVQPAGGVCSKFEPCERECDDDGW